ncbi:uncharacterized protein LOC105430622 [Pogonomyrmex barbatus]|uniref:Uncharacterized protein LOC105430622 n=1 Tax=Pogonomyrmex barbatus TaxID=144034 RepID=A0A6I9WI28_9HYME|nr:uncharacterized protein LOC105430622 [Pogonomyrmex barbatus]
MFGTLLTLKDSDVFVFNTILPINILLVDTNINQEKKTVQMEEMYHLCPCTDLIMTSIENMFPELFIIVTALGSTILDAYLGLHEKDIESINATLIDNFKKLLISINRNQSLLKALGLSNQNINLICAIAQKHSCSCKMISTSGYVFILPLPTTTPEHIDQLKQDLKSHHFFVIKDTYISCDSLKIH